MVIDFSNIELSLMPQFKGGEGVTKNRMFKDGMNKIMQGCLEPGCTIGYHCHETSSEVIYILSGMTTARRGWYPGSATIAPRDTRIA